MVSIGVTEFTANTLWLRDGGSDYRALITDDSGADAGFHMVTLGDADAVSVTGDYYAARLFYWVLPGVLYLRANNDCTRFMLDYHYCDYEEALGGDGSVSVGPFTADGLVSWLDRFTGGIADKSGWELGSPDMRDAAVRVEQFVDFGRARSISAGIPGSMMYDALIILGVVAYSIHPNVPYNVAMTDLTADMLGDAGTLRIITDNNHPVPMRPVLTRVTDDDGADSYCWDLHCEQQP